MIKRSIPTIDLNVIEQSKLIEPLTKSHNDSPATSKNPIELKIAKEARPKHPKVRFARTTQRNPVFRRRVPAATLAAHHKIDEGQSDILKIILYATPPLEFVRTNCQTPLRLHPLCFDKSKSAGVISTDGPNPATHTACDLELAAWWTSYRLSETTCDLMTASERFRATVFCPDIPSRLGPHHPSLSTPDFRLSGTWPNCNET